MLSNPGAAAWGSDDNILPPGDKDGSGIVVTQEVGVHSEPVPATSSAEADDWGYGSYKREPANRS